MRLTKESSGSCQATRPWPVRSIATLGELAAVGASIGWAGLRFSGSPNEDQNSPSKRAMRISALT